MDFEVPWEKTEIKMIMNIFNATVWKVINCA